MAKPSRRIWTISNVLSLSRLALLPVGLYLLSSEDRTLWMWAGGIVIYSIVSDVLDGILARRLHQITEFGKVLDPLADKITSGALAVFCVLERGLPWWAAAATIGRDVLILIAGLILYRSRDRLPTSTLLGKLAALFWVVCLGLYAFDRQPWGRNMLYPTVALFVVAGVAYGMRGWRGHRRESE